MATGVLQGGDTFADSQVVNAARLNNLVNLGDVLAGLISGKPDVTPLTGDFLVYLQVSSGQLKKAKFSEIPSVVSSVGLSSTIPNTTVTGSPITGSGTIVVTQNAVPAGTFLAAPSYVTGGVPVYRILSVGDFILPRITVAATTVDWSLGSVFSKGLTANTTLGMANGTDGQTIYVHVYNTGGAGFTCAFNAVRWPGGVAPTQSPGLGHSDIYQFWSIGGNIYGQQIIKDAF
jgi:hypothetical protein